MYAKSEIMRRREVVGISDVRELVLYLVADAPPPGWVRVENPHSINKVVALLIPGLTPDILSLPPLPTSATQILTSSGVPFINATFTYACPTRAPGDQTRLHSVLNTFFEGPERLISERAQEKSPMRYLLTLEQMVENGYPVPSYLAEVFEKPPGWVETKCLTEDGKQLARVCIIDYTSGIVVYDQLVKPSKPVTDYLTRWSGITAEGLESATAVFDEVQAHVLSVLSVSPTPVLLGHSLESDLQALKICHPRCIDTAVIYHHPRGRPLKPGLAWLTKKRCGREIQNRGEGPGFGEFKVDTESIFERMARARTRSVATASAVVDHGYPSAWHGQKATTCVACTSDAGVLAGLLASLDSHHFIFGHFTVLADVRGWITPKATGDASLMPITQTSRGVEALLETMKALDGQLRELYGALPARTAVVIFTGHADTRRMAELNGSRNVGELEKEARWTSADGRQLEEVQKAKRGLLFLEIKG
ncbi:ribonuclease H-like protein [Ganoderma leucocontextum]|nr:ribonuclease H-like protein [Ganoderma leucocontextum]